jgi:transposase-like protein
MAKQEFSTLTLTELLRTEADAYLLLEKLRWGGTPDACPKCGEVGCCVYVQPSNGTDRATRTGSRSQRRVWRCNGCRKQFSVLTDTIFHGTKISIRTWLLVMFEVASSKNSVSAWEISRKYEITNESAWHLLHRIRRAMERDPLAAMFRGTVQADEAWIGGNPKNRHANDPREPIRRTGAGRTDKQPILCLVHYETREVRSVVVNDVNGETLLAAIDSMAELENTWLQTDGAKAYNPTSPRVRHHLTVNH